MAVTLVLIRHGEARGKRLGETDFDRELTEAGAKALRAAFPKNLSMIEVTKATELWMSKAVRAKQTAMIANETLNIATFRELGSMYEQDQQAFLVELSECEADTVVAVGHIPFMEDMCARLTGSYLGFSTGAAAAIEISDQSMSRIASGHARGRLLWFVQGPDV